MAKSQRIRIRPFALPSSTRDGVDGAARLSIEVNGRILPLTQYVEIVGQIMPQRDETWRRDTRHKA